jgi:hypothetical protein
MNDSLNKFKAELNKAIFGQEKAKEGHCLRCKKGPIDDRSFRDEVSLREYRITHMCQACQDFIYQAEEE